MASINLTGEILQNMDNLTHHLKELDSDIQFNDGLEEMDHMQKQQVKISNSKRRLTNAEKNEL